jgi:hypothetical protein
MYALKFDMDRLFACLNDMGGFLESNSTHSTPTCFGSRLTRLMSYQYISNRSSNKKGA